MSFKGYSSFPYRQEPAPAVLGAHVAGRFRAGRHLFSGPGSRSAPRVAHRIFTSVPTGVMSAARQLQLEAGERDRVAEREIAIVEDRERIARDLHDRVIQRLFAAGLGVEAARRRISDPVIARKLDGVVVELDETIRELRLSIFKLTVSASSGSRRAMIIAVCEAERAALGFDPLLRIEGPVETVDRTLIDHLLAVLRESLSNVAHHARADAVVVTVNVSKDLELSVEDNGVGIPTGRTSTPGHGLANLVSRAVEVGGTCEIRAGSPAGTVIEWRAPQT